jgi:thiol-disulfide isomerase/thioredoxin
MTKIFKNYIVGTLISLPFLGGSCQQALQTGTWRGELTIADGKQAPFIFEVQNATTDSATVTLINGDERVPLTNIRYAADSLVIPIEAYDAVITAKVSATTLEGSFIKNYIENDPGISFRATRGDAPRFAPAASPTTITITGKWDVFFHGDNGTTHNVGIFKADSQLVTGSILTNSGDLRFLEGALTDSGVQLSAFSGLSPYLLEIQFTGPDAFEGTLYTAQSKTTLTGSRNDQATLVDPYSLTKLNKGFDQLHFQLPNAEGQTVSLNDERYKNKVVIVSVLGSWCPNCLDEIKYLAPWYKENKDRGVEIIGLAFERKNDAEYGNAAINRLKQRYGVDYEILFAGQANNPSVAEVLPEIDNFSSYPTLIFIDKKGKVAKIHTGFNGPATGLFYEAFKEEFNALVSSLLN